MALLRAAYFLVATHLQEASDAMSSNEVRDGLQNAISAAHDGDPAHSGHSHNYVDHTGDDESGDVTFTCDPDNDGDTDFVRAPYTKGTDSSDDDFSIDTSKGKQVAQRTSWEELPDDADGYAAMQEAKLYTKGGCPLVERFVSKKERDAASSSDFAGKGKSFPILKPADVSAAASSLGRAGSGNLATGTIKANIIRIAKAKGWTSELPKAWQDGGDDDKTKESKASAPGTLKLVESCAFPVDIELREAFEPDAKSLIKLISPGKGSSAYYTEAALKQAVADKIFHAGLPMRIDHPTRKQEAERPEGSVKDWGAVLREDAQWLDSYLGKGGKDQGSGLYSPIKKFSDHAQTINEKGPFAGVSIMATGEPVMESGRPVMREGVPVLAKFTSAEGADMVTRAGAGGMFLTEAAGSGVKALEKALGFSTEGGGELTTAEAQKLIEAAVKPFQTRFLRDEARSEAAKLLETVGLPPAAKLRITERAIAAVPQTADGGLDLAKFREAVVLEAKSEGEYLAAVMPQGVRGMGVAGVIAAPPKPEEIAAREAAAKRDFDDEVAIYEAQGMSRKAAEFAAKGRPEEDWAA